MEKKNLKLLSLVLACLLLLPVFSLVGCDKKPESPVTTDPSAPVSGTETSETAAPADDYTAPDEDMDGYEFIAYEVMFNETEFVNDFRVAEDAVTVIDQAIFNRNTAVEDKYKIKISEVYKKGDKTDGTTAGYGGLIQLQTSGDTPYDCAVLPGYDCAKLAHSGALTDLASFAPSVLDFSHSWWDQQAREAFTIKDMLFFTTGDFSVDIPNATVVVTFNKNLAKQHEINDLYQLVEDGKWTMDKWMEYSSLVHEDLDGNGLLTEKDLYGSLLWDDSIYAAVNAAGERCCDLDEDGNLILTIGTERLVSAFQKYVEFAKTESCLRYQQKFNETTGEGTSSPFAGHETRMFPNDQGLFLITAISVVTRNFRDMDTDYGILPMFKYDEAQDRYYNNIAPWSSRFLCMPVNLEDADRSAKILEAIGHFSTKTVMNAYYEKTLHGSTVRDEESLPMLELINKTRMYDLGLYYQPANINKQMIVLFRVFNSNWMSRYNTYKISAEKQLEKINEEFDAIKAS